MKKILKRISSLVSALFCIYCLNISSLYASSFSVGASSTSINQGASATVSISGSDVTGRFNIASSNPGIVSISSSSIWVENGSSNVTVSGISAGTSTITVTPANVANSNGEDITLDAKSITITVNAPVTNTNNTTNNKNNNNGKKTNNTKKSSNANLRNLVIDQEGLSPMFSSVVTNYTLTVPSKVTNLKITPTVEQAGAKYWITGDEDLQMGNNKVTITVTAPDGTKKTYTINVNRVEDTEKSDVALKSLIIDGVELSPEFSPDTLEYDLGQFDSSVKKLTILAFASSDNATIEIQGNDNFKPGENIIKIIVTAEDKTTTREYILKLNMDEAVLDDTQDTEQNPYQDIYEEPTRLENFINNAKKNKLLLVTLLVTIIELIEIIILYKRLYRKSKDSFNSNYNIDLDDFENSNTKTSKRRRQNSDDKLHENLNLDNEKEVVEDISQDNINNSENKASEDNEECNILNLEEIKKKIEKEKIVDKNDSIDEVLDKTDEKEINKDDNETEDNRNLEKGKNQEIDFENLVKETLAKYEEEDKIDSKKDVKLDLDMIEKRNKKDK